MIESFVRAALAEDVGRGDLYALVEPAVDSLKRRLSQKVMV